MFTFNLVAAVTALCVSNLATATVLQPHQARAGSGVCSNGIYRELGILAQYPPAVTFCAQKFPVKCNTGKGRRQVASKASANPSKSSPTSSDAESSAFSKCLKQPISIISTLCSCIQTPKPCPTSKPTTKSTRPTPPSTTRSPTRSSTKTTSATPTATACSSAQSNFCTSQNQNICFCQLDVDGVSPVCSNGSACPQQNFPNPLTPCASDADCVLYYPDVSYHRCVYSDYPYTCTPTFCATEDGCVQPR